MLEFLGRECGVLFAVLGRNGDLSVTVAVVIAGSEL